MTEQGPWTYDEVDRLVEFGSSDWHGGPRPPDLPAGCAPGGLAFGLWEPPDVIWDGDSGRPAMMITAGETADR